MKDRCEDLADRLSDINSINSQEALILLRSSFSASKLLHLLRWQMPNLMQILSIFLKLQAVKQCGPGFWPTLYYNQIFKMAAVGNVEFSKFVILLDNA